MFWIIILTASLLSAQSGTRARFSADEYTKKTDEDKVILTGKVNIVKNNTILKADCVELDTKTEDFKATGKVSYVGDRLKITGTEIDGDLNSPKGFIKDGKIVSGIDVFEGREIHRLTKADFTLKEGRYTSCANTPPDWRMYGNDIDITTEEYAHLTDVVIEVFGVPTVYMPYLVLPVKSKRQTGFLPPRFGFGVDGFNIHEPFFWAMTRSQDMTFTLGHYGNRGTKEGVEFRSMYAEESFTNMYYFHIDDQMFAKTVVDGQPLNVKNRYGFKMGQEFKFFENTYAKMKALYASDSNVPRDFSEEMEGRAEPSLESKLVVMTHSKNFAYTGNASFYEDMLSKNPLSSGNTQLQRLPELTVSLAKTKFSEFMFEGDVSYLNVYRSGKPFDDSNNNGYYEDGEFIRTGQRVDFYPRVSMPITSRFFRITPQVGARYDYYMLPVNGDASRAYFDFKTDLTSEISSVYKRDHDKRYRALKHIIQPIITYELVPPVKQTNHPFFNTSADSPMFDSIDKKGRASIVTYGITNRLLAKYITNFIDPKELKKKPEYKCPSCKNVESVSITKGSTEKFLGLREKLNADEEKEPEDKDEVDNFSVAQPVQWKLYQTYDFLDTTGKPFGYVHSDIEASYEWVYWLNQLFYNVYTKKTGVNNVLGLSDGTKYVELGYYVDKTTSETGNDQLKLRFGFVIWRFGTNIRFILNNNFPGTLSNKMQDKYIDLTYNPPSSCWILKLAANAPYDRPGVDVSITFNLMISGQAIGFGAQDSFWSKVGYSN